MGYCHTPEGGTRRITLIIIKSYYLITERFILVKIIGLIVPICIQSIHNTVCVRIQKLYHYTIIGRHPNSSVSIIVAYWDNSPYIKTKEIIHPDDDRLFKTNPLCAIHAKLCTVCVCRRGRQNSRHGLGSRILGGSCGDGGQFMNIIAVFIH